MQRGGGSKRPPQRVVRLREETPSGGELPEEWGGDRWFRIRNTQHFVRSLNVFHQQQVVVVPPPTPHLKCCFTLGISSGGDRGGAGGDRGRPGDRGEMGGDRGTGGGGGDGGDGVVECFY